MYAPSQDLLADQCRHCGKLLKRRRTGRVRKFCSARCRKAYSRIPASFVTLTGVSVGMSRNSKNSLVGSVASKGKKGGRASQLTPAQMAFCNSVGREAVATANRQNARFWREAMVETPIEAGGDYFTEPDWREVISPDGVKCYVTRFRQPEAIARLIAIADDLSVPDFLKRTPTELMPS